MKKAEDKLNAKMTTLAYGSVITKNGKPLSLNEFEEYLGSLEEKMDNQAEETNLENI